MGANKPHCCVDGCHVLNAGNAKHTCFCLALCIRALHTPHGQEAGQYPERRLQMTLRKETGNQSVADILAQSLTDDTKLDYQ